MKNVKAIIATLEELVVKYPDDECMKLSLNHYKTMEEAKPSE